MESRDENELALAAGIALPSLAWLGYHPGVVQSNGGLLYLAGVYALLPCMLKAVAALALIKSPFFRRGELPGQFRKLLCNYQGAQTCCAGYFR